MSNIFIHNTQHQEMRTMNQNQQTAEKAADNAPEETVDPFAVPPPTSPSAFEAPDCMLLDFSTASFDEIKEMIDRRGGWVDITDTERWDSSWDDAPEVDHVTPAPAKSGNNGGWQDTGQEDAPHSPPAPDDQYPSAPRVETSLVEDTVPWHVPVDGLAIANQLRTRIESHVAFPSPHFAVLVTLWILGTYCMPVWRLWPRLLITAALWASGKSVLLEVVHAFALRGAMLSNCTTASVYRILSQFSPTLCLDEADTWLKHRSELGGIFNASHVRSQARVARGGRGNGPGGAIDIHNIWCPIAIAGIGTQRNTLVSRSIVVTLQRKLPTDNIEPIGFDIYADMGNARRQILRWALDSRDALRMSVSVPPDCGNPRRRDNYRPLYQLADTLGGPWPQLLEDAYLGTMDTGDAAEEMPALVLLGDIHELFAKHPSQSALRTADIVDHLCALEESPWAGSKGNPAITPRKIAGLLRPLGVRSHDKRDGQHVTKHYMRADIEAAYARCVAPQKI